MNKVQSIYLDTHSKIHLELDLMGSGYDNSRPLYTVITGRNGSYKSMILKKIAENAMMDEIEKKESAEVNFDISDSRRFKVIAYSGAAIDRYPLKKARRKSPSNTNCYTYLGQKAGANIISRRQPFETMLAESFSFDKVSRMKAAFFKNVFNLVNLQPRIYFTLAPNHLNKQRSGYSSLYELVYASSLRSVHKKEKSRLVDSDLASYLINEFQEVEFYELENEYNRKIKINFSEDGINELNIKTRRMIRLGLLVDAFRITQAEVTSLATYETFSLYDLSTGEFNMLNSILGLGFAVEQHSIVLIDEPEVSLHPQWQVEFISIISEIFTNYRVSHVIVSTHSPLIVSSVTDNCLIIDLNRDGESSEEKQSFYGASTDEILINHFGLATGRNFFVMDTLQQAVSLIENGKENTSDFRELIPELQKIQAALSENDPMIEVIKVVISHAN